MSPDRALLHVGANALRITRHVGRRRRSTYSRDAYVPWRLLDELADAMRAAGVDPGADNLGREAREHLEELLEARQGVRT